MDKYDNAKIEQSLSKPFIFGKDPKQMTTKPYVTKPLHMMINNPPVYLNEKNTLLRIYGSPTLDWETDLSTLNEARSHNDIQPINPLAKFQSKILHSNRGGPKLPPVAPQPTVPKLPPVAPQPTVPKLPPVAPQPTVPKLPPVVVQPTTSKLPPVVVQPTTSKLHPVVVQPTTSKLKGAVTNDINPGPPKISTYMTNPVIVSGGNVVNSKTNEQNPITTQPSKKIETSRGADHQISRRNGKQTIFHPIPMTEDEDDGRIGGLTTISVTTLTPTIPTISSETAVLPGSTDPTYSNKEVPTVIMPTFNRSIQRINSPVKRPLIIQATQGAPLMKNLGGKESVLSVLSEIDPELLVGERTGKNKKGYSLAALQGFTQRLGLTVSGKRKQELIDNIQNLRREMGVL
jgi:hypothetical protein